MADIMNYKQYSPPWGGLSYAGGTIADSGCGGASGADLIGRKADPGSTCGWLTLHGYASNGHGTFWGGIPAVLQAYGVGASQMNYVSLYGVHSSSVFTAWREQIRAGYCGVLLMGPGRFTSGGHYIAITGYANDLYRVYDPAGRQDGWHPWSDFAGQIKICYTSQKKWIDEPEPETWHAIGTATCTDNGVNVRATPGGAVIGTLNTGQRFEIDGQEQDGYTHVKIAGIGIAWIATAYIRKDTAKYAYSFAVPGLKPKTNSRAVTLFERLLAPKNIYKGPSDTIYGDGCVEACKKIQELRALPQTGNCYLAEWKIITGLPYASRKFRLQEVRSGSQGASVVFVQLVLKAYGFYTGAVDGIAGDQTITAIRIFQKRFNLQADGIAGAKTLKAIVGF